MSVNTFAHILRAREAVFEFFGSIAYSDQLSEQTFWDAYALFAELDDLDLSAIIRESEVKHDA